MKTDTYGNGHKGFDSAGWKEKLAQISSSLKSKANLTLMGSGPNMLRGQESRMSIDLDVWSQSSQFNEKDLKEAVEASGLLYNPKGASEPSTPYIQIVEPGICQLGKFVPAELSTLSNLSDLSSQFPPNESNDSDKVNNLTISFPPIENLIASKLLRATPTDLEDITWMLAQFQPNLKKVREIVESFPSPQKDTAKENLIYLDVLKTNNIKKNEKKIKNQQYQKKQREIQTLGVSK